jgi:hypothetical protein
VATSFSTCVVVAARVIGIATHYRLDSPRINFQLSKVFCAIHTVPKAYLASSTMDTASFLGVKWPESMVLTNHLLLLPGYK